MADPSAAGPATDPQERRDFLDELDLIADDLLSPGLEVYPKAARIIRQLEADLAAVRAQRDDYVDALGICRARVEQAQADLAALRAAVQQAVTRYAPELDWLQAIAEDSTTVSGWHPMHAAPIDGTPVLIAMTNGCLDVMWAEHGEWTNGDRFTQHVTHWMPLPASPRQIDA